MQIDDEPKVAIDDIDVLLIDALQDNARASYRELGAQVGLTPPAVAARLKRLEQTGVITGYTVKISPAALGHPILSLVRIKSIGKQKAEDFDKRVADIPEIVECRRVTGTDSHVARAYLRSTSHLEEVLDQFWQYGETITNIVTSSPVPRRSLRVRNLVQYQVR